MGTGRLDLAIFAWNHTKGYAEGALIDPGSGRECCVLEITDSNDRFCVSKKKEKNGRFYVMNNESAGLGTTLTTLPTGGGRLGSWA